MKAAGRDAASTFFSAAAKAAATAMDQIPSSPRPIGSMPVVGVPLAPFYPAFPFRDKDTQIVLGDNAPPPQHGLPLLQDASAFQQSSYALTSDGAESTSFAGALQGMKLIPDPPDLDYWRHKLFDVDETITLTEEQ